MKVKLILPSVAEAGSPDWRPIKYSLFPPLGLATLAAYLREDDEIVLQDEHVQPLDLDEEPHLVGIEIYVTNAYRAYAIADHYRQRGAHVALGGLHVTALPAEAANHADTIFIGPGEDTWPAFLADLCAGSPGKLYQSRVRTLAGAPLPRRDLIDRRRYLAPNSIVVSRGCPYACDFCYKEAFYAGGRSFYVRAADEALAEIETLPGRHLFFLDDHLFGNVRFAEALFAGLAGRGRGWQAAGTVEAVLRSGLLEEAAASGLRSLFVGFETLSAGNLAAHGKRHNLGRDYDVAVRRLHDLGVVVNGSFIFELDEDDETVFDRTVEWAVQQGIETATFHILTPYPGTPLHRRLAAAGRILHDRWDLYDTRHAVFRPARMTPEALEAGYHRAYRDFYSWRSIFHAAAAHGTVHDALRHLAYTVAWKKCEPLWDVVIRSGMLWAGQGLLEALLAAGRPAASPLAARNTLADRA